MGMGKYRTEIEALLDELAHDDDNEESVLKDIKAATQQALLRLKMYQRKEKKGKKSA